MLKIKTNSRIFSIVFILAFFVSAFCIAAKAETISSETYESTITVNIKTDDNPLENVKLKLYKIAGGKDSGSYTVSEKLKAYSLEYNFLDNTTFDSLITTLEGYIAADNIQPDYEGSTDIGGKALFENLPYGAYLLTGDTYNDDAVTVTPVSTLVFLPYRDDKGEVNCNAVIELKCSIKKAPASPEKITVYKVWKDNNDSVRPSEVKPVSITDENAMKKLMKSNDPKNVKADKIKTRIESELKQVRYDDPLLFEEFSTKIKKTLAEYDETRDADKYFTTMETMADDFRNGRLSKEYPVSIANDSDTKAFYGAVITVLRSKTDLNLSDDVENAIAEHSRNITQAVSSHAKRDWKHNEVVHKQIHRVLDDCLFELFDEIGYEIDNSNIDTLDLIIDEIMKVAVARY